MVYNMGYPNGLKFEKYPSGNYTSYEHWKDNMMVTANEIQKALDGIRPHLQADGGDVEFVSLSDDGVVSVRLKGACGSCPMALKTLKSGIEAQLKEFYPDIKKVVSI